MLHFRSRIGEDVSKAEQLILPRLTVSNTPSECVYECNASGGNHKIQTRCQCCHLDLSRYRLLLPCRFDRVGELIRWLASESQLVRKWG